jgi:23S rRNA G2445 N2-methylase RlmL
MHRVMVRMLRGLEATPRCLLVDPACGVGTIPIEAALVERRADVAGFDLEPAAVAVAHVNAHRAGTDVRLAVADAACLPFEDGSVDLIVVPRPPGCSLPAAASSRCSRPGQTRRVRASTERSWPACASAEPRRSSSRPADRMRD